MAVMAMTVFSCLFPLERAALSAVGRRLQVSLSASGNTDSHRDTASVYRFHGTNRSRVFKKGCTCFLSFLLYNIKMHETNLLSTSQRVCHTSWKK